MSAILRPVEMVDAKTIFEWQVNPSISILKSETTFMGRARCMVRDRLSNGERYLAIILHENFECGFVHLKGWLLVNSKSPLS